MFAYARSAIDFWPGWLAEDEYIKQLEKIYGELGNSAKEEIARYKDFRDKAYALSTKIGWEGDIREGPFIAGLPTHENADDGHFMIAWKQDNNGDTFAVSPYKIPWLETGDYGEWIAA